MVTHSSYGAIIVQSLATGCLHKVDDRIIIFNVTAAGSLESYSKSNGEDPSLSESSRSVDGAGCDSLWSEESAQRTASLWELTATDASNLRELGRRLRDLDHRKNNPGDVVRFLQARPGDVDAAESMFREMVMWRHRNKVDTILKDYRPPQELVDHFPGAILHSLDKDGDPVMVVRTGVTDGASMLMRFGKHEMLRHAIWLRELINTGDWIKKYEQEQKRPVKRVLIIEDVYRLPLLHSVSNRPLIDMHREVMRLDQDNYPETAKKIIVIRAPSLFTTVWSIVQHFLDPGVRQKVVLCGMHNYKEVLSEHVDLKILPDCMVPGIGEGKAASGMPSNFNGGRLPSKKELRPLEKCQDHPEII